MNSKRKRKRRKKMLKKKNCRRRKKEKKEERVFREVVFDKVVGPCMGKGNNNKKCEKILF